MKPNIFWRSTRRQLLRTLLLLLLTAAVVFAFTARAAEYLLVRQEADRLGGYYKAVGRISRLKDATGDMASFDEVKEFLENDPRVAHTENWTQECSAVLQGMYNADVFGLGSSEKCKNNYFYFTGTLLGVSEVRGLMGAKPSVPTLDGDWDVYCYFRQERSLAGPPELVWEGHIVRVRIPQEQARAALETLTVGKQYLLCVRTYWLSQLSGDLSIEKPTVQNPAPDAPILRWESMKGGEQFNVFPLAPGGPLFYPVPDSGEIDWSDPALAGVEEEIRTCREEQSALWVTTTQDMEIMSGTQSDGDIYLVDGRWLNYADHIGQKKVCVVHNELLKVRGLAIGDTITLKLRDIDADHFQWGYILFPYMEEYETATETFEIVGSYDRVRPHPNGFHVMRNTVYIPTSAMPEGFEATNAYYRRWIRPSDLNFVLTSSNVIEEFLADTRDGLAAMTLQANMLDTGWNAFQAAVQPLLRSSLYNLIIFGLILLTALCLVAFFYLRARMRDAAIARALGVPAGVCVRQGALPLLLIGLAGTAGGAVPGWQYALKHGEETLLSLSTYGAGAAETALPRFWLAAIFGGILLLFFVLSLGGMAYLSHKPTLELLRGNARANPKEEKAAAQATGDMKQGEVVEAQAAFAPPDGAEVQARRARRALGVAHTLRFVCCYIRRSKAKSLLTLLLAALFTVGLAAIRLSILHSGERIDGLYDAVSIEMSLMRKNASDYVMGGGFAAQKTIDSINETEVARDVYLEGECALMRIRREDVFLEDGDAAVQDAAARDGDTGWSSSNGPAAQCLSFSDPDSFLAHNAEVEISYHDGWDAGMFAEDWSGSDTLPVLMPDFLYRSLNIPVGGRIALDVLREDIGVYNVHVVEVAGTYTGMPNAGKSGSGRPCLLAPAGVMDAITQGHTFYSTARFTLDSSWNRELDTVRTAAEEILEAPGAGLIPLRPVIRDEELTQAVEPLENSILLMEMLFPVALALSLLAALGVSALLILTEAREAAIMRVLGTTRLRSRIILSLQVIFMVLAGLMIGLAVSFAWAGRLGLAWATIGLSVLCAAAYLLCATVGSATGAVILTNRPPLELLQVKE